ncbi:MAG: PDGLE domain-containing protein [Candidatus Saganbacteria bacterium]|nr:PDGLE domain-containing protein [Candidatus Saganbacteria bacterium]
MKKNIIILAVLIAAAASFFASAHPDGLEKVAETLGFLDAGVERTSVMTDYSVPFVAHEAVSAALSGIIGIALCLGVFWLAAVIMKSVRRPG